MDLKDLTPELFEKTEFAERRRGYDIDQVENFLEETGTAVAQLLVRHRQLEERAAAAEARLAEAEAQLAQRPEPTAAATVQSDDVERATSTLVMAKRTAEATIAEAETEATRVRGEAARRAEEIVAEAHRTAEEELNSARRHTTEVVTALEARRDAVASVVEGFEHRIVDYRAQLAEASDALRAIVDDPGMLAAREPVQVPDSAVGHTPTTEVDVEDFGGAAAAPPLDLTDATQVHDTATAAREELGDEPGVETGSAPADDQASSTLDARVRESSVIVDAEPVTGQTSDRFLRELDEAVNESDQPEGGDDAMSAFFGGDGGEPGRSRFGWRR